ncbi:MAG: hypothetical protein ACRDRA_08845 [Pseudonocardiaceae bacterium]
MTSRAGARAEPFGAWGGDTASGLITSADFASGGATFPITGGTGDFVNVGGEFEIKFAPVFTDPATLTLRLTKPLALPLPLVTR